MLTGHVDLLSRSEFVGWAADPSNPNAVVRIVAIVNGRLVERMEANLAREDLARLGQFGHGAHGFAGRFTPALSAEAAHAVTIAFEADGRPLTHGQVRFYPAKISPAQPAPPAPGCLRPLLITSLGRSGSTLLMHRLRQQPEIVVPGLYPYETRIGAYYANVYRVLTAFDDVAARADPNLMATAPRVGALPFEAAVQRFPALFRHQAPSMIAAWARQVTVGYYAAEAALAGVSPACLFAEKCNFSGDDRAILRSLFPDLLEIVLVRDLRDLYCSSRAFWELDERAGLGRLSQANHVIVKLWQEKCPSLLLLRYEDLVRQPQETADVLHKFLGLSAPFATDPTSETALLSGHATTPDPPSSIGRWRGETLPDAVRDFVANAADFNRIFGYEETSLTPRPLRPAQMNEAVVRLVTP
jgi:hypothetical protein